MANLKEEIGQRLELLQRRINELVEQQKVTERQIRAYKALVRHYHAVYQAEHGLSIEGELTPKLIDQLEQIASEGQPTKETKGHGSATHAVLEIMSQKADALHASQIAKEVIEKYPAIAQRVKDIQKAVVLALVRGVQQGLYERVGRSVYKLKTNKDG